MDNLDLSIKYLNDEDCFFLENVMTDIRSFIQKLNESNNKKKVLLFPPVSNFRRFLIHKVVEETFHTDKLATISIGRLYGRRTVIYPSIIVHMEASENVPKIMDVEPKVKSSSIPIYRPPAVRKRENIAKSSILQNKDRKNRKPDIQIYVPRAKRLSNIAPIQDENKCQNEVVDLIDEHEKKTVEVPSKKSKETKENKQLCDSEKLPVNLPVDNLVSQSTVEDACFEKQCSVNTVNTFSVFRFDESQIELCKSKPDVVEPPVIEVESDSDQKNEIEEIEPKSSEGKPNSDKDEIIEIINVDEIHSPKPELGEFNVRVNSDLSNSESIKTEKKTSSPTKKLDVETCDWEELFDESGDYVDDSLINELMTAIGKVSVQKATQDYRPFQTEEERSSDGECIIEVYGFPSEFKTDDLFNIFMSFRSDKGFQIVWVDDTHALAVFSSPLIADEVLNTQLPCVKTRPLKNAIAKSKMKASNYVLPPATRPKTCASLARRLVSGHLGMKINVTPKQREAEKKLLSDAREQKRLQARQKIDAWEGTSSGKS